MMKRIWLALVALGAWWNSAVGQVIFYDGFESFPDTVVTTPAVFGMWTYTKTDSGRLQTAYQPYRGQRAITLDASAVQFSNNWWTLTVDLSAYDTAVDTLVLEFWVTDYGDETDAGDSIAIRGDSSQPWINLYQMTPGSWTNGAWQKLSFSLTDALRNGGQQFDSTFQIRFAQYDNYPVATDGIAFDDVKIYIPGPDVAVVALDSPISGCGLTNSEAVQFKVVNLGTPLAAGDTISYGVVLNGTSVCNENYVLTSSVNVGDTITIAAPSSCNVNLATPGTYTVTVYVDPWWDIDLFNDTLDAFVESQPTVSTFPYAESFESGPGGWVTGSESGRTSSFEWGDLAASPAPGTIDTAADGVMAWETDIDGDYFNNQGDWVESPCFDFSAFVNPVKFSAWVWWDAEFSWDGAALDTMVDPAAGWGRVGQQGDPFNWYNDNTISGLYWTGNAHGWSGTATNNGSGGWVRVTRILPNLSGRSNVRFRFVFGSDGSVNSYDGFAFDMVQIEELWYDVAVTAINRPLTGCGLGSAEPIWITIANVGLDLNAGDTVPYSVQVGTNTCNSFLVVGSNGLPMGSDTTFQTTCTGDFSMPGTTYTIGAWTSLPGDADTTNDLLVADITHNMPPPLSAGDIFFDDFECMPDLATQTSGTILLSGNPGSPWTYTNSDNGRLQTAYTNYDPAGGARAITLDANPSGPFSSNWMTLELDLSLYDTAVDVIMLSVYARDHGDETHPGDSIAIRGSSSDPWINIEPSWAPTTSWQEYFYNITDTLKKAGQNFSATFQVRFAQYDNFPVPSDGISIDRVRIYQLLPDVGVVSIDSPVTDCGLGSNETIWLTMHNYGAFLFPGDTVPYFVQVDTGVICSDFLVVGASGWYTGQDTSFASSCTGDFSAPQNYVVRAWTALPADSATANDSAAAVVTSIPLVSSFPYVEDFESGPGGWANITVSGGTSPWEHGQPSAYTYANNTIDTAAQGLYAWEVNIDGDYDDNQIVALVSPCFDFSGHGRVIINFKGYWDSEPVWDGTRFDTLVLTGTNVNDVVGDQNATNWYNYTSISALGSAGWSGNSGGWMDVAKVFTHELAGHRVRFAFIFASDGSVSYYDGFGVDSFAISTWSYCFSDTDTVIICAGDSALIHGQWQYMAGTYVDTFQVGGCDSISTVFLSVIPAVSTSVTDTICQGDTAWIGNTPYTQAGTHTDTLTTVLGCDSIVTLTLTVLPSPSYTMSQTICQGDTVWVGGMAFTQAGTHTITFTAANGCDSVVTLNLTVNPTYNVSDTVMICQGDSALIHGQWQTQAGVYSHTYTSAAGCDSVVNTTLVVNPTYNVSDTVMICQGDSALIHGQWQTQAGVYSHTYTSAAGCDSVVNTTLVVNPTYNVSDTVMICQGDSALIHGQWQTQPGVYSHTYTSAAGCDSVVNTALVVNPVYNVLDTVVICQGDSVLIHGQWQTQPGVYAHTYTSAGGCDSNVYTTLIVNPTYAVNVTDTICQGDTAWIGNMPYTQAGTYTQTLSSAAGCDSVVTLNLSVTVVDTTVVVSGDTLTVQQSNATYQWLDCNNNMSPISGATAQSYVATASGSYAVQVTYMGCVATSGCHVVVMSGLAEVERTFGMKVYPNPTRGTLYVETDRRGAYEFRLYDLLGKEYWRRRTYIDGRYAIHLGEVAKGIYFLEIRSGDQVEVLQLRVE